MTAPGPAAASSLAGKIALIDRGTCSVSLKVDSAAKAGAIGVLIGLVAPGDAVSFSYGGGDALRADAGDPAVAGERDQGAAHRRRDGQRLDLGGAPIPLVGSMVGTSSRGPSYGTQRIKPEIGAPGASVSAVVGTGTGETAFGGTSGAAPMVAGAAALLVQAFPTARRCRSRRC